MSVFISFNQADINLLREVTTVGYALVELSAIEEQANSKKDGTNVIYSLVVLEDNVDKGVVHRHVISRKNDIMFKRNLLAIAAACRKTNPTALLETLASSGEQFDAASDIGQTCYAKFDWRDNGQGKQVLQVVDFKSANATLV